MILNSPPAHQLTLMVDVVSVPPCIFSLKLKDPTWSASLRGVLGTVDISICYFHKKTMFFQVFALSPIIIVIATHSFTKIHSEPE